MGEIYLFLFKAGLSAHPLTMFGLLKHENKMSILNLLLKRTSSHNSAIMSKDKLIFHIGARRFTAAPIYSQHTNGDKHKVSKNDFKVFHMRMKRCLVFIMNATRTHKTHARSYQTKIIFI